MLELVFYCSESLLINRIGENLVFHIVDICLILFSFIFLKVSETERTFINEIMLSMLSDKKNVAHFRL